MRLDRHQFARLLATVTKVVESRNTIPILSTVRLVAEGGRLTATATDLDIQITGSVLCEGDFAGCLDAKMLSGIVNKLTGDTVDISDDDGQVCVKASRSRFKKHTLPIDDFPSIDVGALPHGFDCDLAAMVGPARFAISTEETRFYLCGVYLQPESATATDGHRLSTRKHESLGDFPGVILPSKLVGMLPKGKVHVDLSDTKVRITADADDGGTVIVSKLIDGTFPDYDRVIPKNNDKFVTFDNAELRAAAERVAVAAEQRGRGVRLDITADAIALSLRGEAEAQDSVAVDAGGLGDEPLTVGFNVTYLADVLNNLPSGPVDLALADGGSPALFTSNAAEGQRIVLMPMRVT